MNNPFFIGIETLEELKKEYHRLAMIHHPDMGGDLEIMKAINAEFDLLHPLLKNKHKNKDGEAYESKQETQETPQEWQEIINLLFALHMLNVKIEIIGSFIWLSGNTKPYCQQIKDLKLGFRYSSKKQAWYKSPAGYKKNGGGEYDMNKIRGMYGSQTVQEKEQRTVKQITNS